MEKVNSKFVIAILFLFILGCKTSMAKECGLVNILFKGGIDEDLIIIVESSGCSQSQRLELVYHQAEKYMKINDIKKEYYIEEFMGKKYNTFRYRVFFHEKKER